MRHTCPPSHLALLLSALLAAGCGGSTPTGPSSPPSASLTFAATPNPVPFSGVFAGCAGSPVAAKTWNYTLRITNQGTAAFTIASFSSRVTGPSLGTSSVDTPYDAALFTAAFGGSTIPPQGTLTGPLCVAGQWDAATLTWTFVGTGGASFTAPAITFLPSGQ